MSWPSADAISDTSEYGAFTDLTNDMILAFKYCHGSIG